MTTLEDFRMTAPWDDEIVFGEVLEYDKMCRHGSRRYLPQEVLNDRITEGLTLWRRGQVVEGCLLGSGLARIPAEYQTGALVACQAIFTTSLGEEISTTAKVMVHRVKDPRQAWHQIESSLYGGSPCSVSFSSYQPEVQQRKPPEPEVDGDVLTAGQSAPELAQAERER